MTDNTMEKEKGEKTNNDLQNITQNIYILCFYFFYHQIKLYNSYLNLEIMLLFTWSTQITFN